MEKTIMTGDKLFVSRLSFIFQEPKRFDIAVFKYPDAPAGEEVLYVKRIIGLPGEKVEIINDGEDLNIGINSKYLKDALSVIEDEEISINFKDSVSPAIIKPLKGDKYTYLILPIRMN